MDDQRCLSLSRRPGKEDPTDCCWFGLPVAKGGRRGRRTLEGEVAVTPLQCEDLSLSLLPPLSPEIIEKAGHGNLLVFIFHSFSTFLKWAKCLPTTKVSHPLSVDPLRGWRREGVSEPAVSAISLMAAWLAVAPSSSSLSFRAVAGEMVEWSGRAKQRRGG